MAKTKRGPAKTHPPPTPVYGGNDKHQVPWQRGRKGSLCTKKDIEQAQDLLDESVLKDKKRFATDGQRAFAGEQHGPHEWHGWPVGWKEVPELLRHRWIDEGRVKRSSINRHWHRHEGDR